ncbi:hypothetical protein NIES2098_22320 [Calothrix sp. NIES-2098]|nr:hypothetical protein NIES2098_22320 [Calothrix sp. NIES-2098]
MDSLGDRIEFITVGTGLEAAYSERSTECNKSLKNLIITT